MNKAQISIVFARGILVKSERMSNLPMKLLEFWWSISEAKLSEPLNVYLLAVNGSKIDTKRFAGLYVGVCKAHKLVWNANSHQHTFYAFYKKHT